MKNEILKRSRFGILILSISVLTATIFGQNASDLNGTFRIDQNRSDDVSAMVESIAASNGLSDAERGELEDQLAAPERVSITTYASDPKRVTVSTSSSAETTFQADGRTQQVGQTNVSATLRNGTLRLSKVDGDSSYSITFESTGGGSGLRVTRMITTSYLNQTVYADSYYSKQGGYAAVNGQNDDDDSDGSYSSSDPDDVYSDSGSTSNTNYPTTRTVNGRFVVPKGVVLNGTLNNKITTKASQNNDRFSIAVESPGEYSGAIIKGYLSGIKRTGRISGSSRLTFNFETITLRSGETFDFAGVLQSVTDSSGKVIEVGEEGDAKGKSKTKESVKRGGIGAGLGAIIGAVLGGGKGAIIGATIGGGAGAGSVIAEGRDDIELLPGSTITVESSSPNTVR